MAFCVPLLNDDPCSKNGCELNPAPAVAVPVLGNCNGPREITLPFTSSVAAGVIVLMPTATVLPEPDWNSTELPRTELLVQRGTKSVVPEPLTRAVAPTSEPAPALLPLFGAFARVGTANTKAEAGRPPTVSASPAFNA